MTAQRSDVAALLSRLIRFDTSNPGGPERPAAEWLAERLDAIKLEPQIVEAAPGRASLVARVEGTDPSLQPLLLHGHLDVVPADPHDWQHHPFSGEIVDGWVWGRGAIDMKHMIAMLVALFEDWHERGVRPRRSLVLAFVADEEAGGREGSHFLVDRHPDLIADCSQAVGEVGGFSVTVARKHRAYMIQTGEKGLAWLRLRTAGSGGHGSMLHDDNPVFRLARSLAAVAAEPREVIDSQTMRAFTRKLGEGIGSKIDPEDPAAWIGTLGSAERMIGAAFANTVNATVISGGQVPNTVPNSAEAMLDVRWVPGHEEATMRRLQELLGPEVEIETVVHAPSIESPTETSLVAAMERALMAEDEAAIAVPYLMSGGTDAKAFVRLGLECYGFAPLLLPATLDFTSLFHGVDERVPVAALEFGVRVLDRLLTEY